MRAAERRLSDLAAKDAEIAENHAKIQRLIKCKDKRLADEMKVHAEYSRLDKVLDGKCAEIEALKTTSEYWETSFQQQVKVSHSIMLELDAPKAEIVATNNKAVSALTQELAYRDAKIAGLTAYSEAGEKEIYDLRKENTDLKSKLVVQGIQLSEVKGKELELVRARRDKWQSAFQQLAGNITRDVEAAKRNSNS